jgi:hypothetical protein
MQGLRTEVVWWKVRTYRAWWVPGGDKRIAPALAWRWSAPAQVAFVYFAWEGTT